jgi:branched-chain amino acid transport system substrate-binding protein
LGCYVGVAGPLTGPFAGFGDQLRRGVELAVSDLNKKGMKVELIVADDTCRPEAAGPLAERLIDRDKVVCVVGHFCSTASMAASTVYERRQVVQIVPAPFAFAPTAVQRFVFRLLPDTAVEAERAGRLLADRFKDKTVAVVSSNAPSSRGLAVAVAQSMNKYGLKVSANEEYTLGASDFAPLAERLRAVRVDAFYVAGPALEAARIIRQVRQMGVPAQMISGSILGAGEFGRVSGSGGDGTLMISSLDARNLPEAKEVVAAFRNSNFEPEGFTLYGYAAVQAWAHAVGKINTDDPKRVAEILHGTEPADTVIGKVAFDDRGFIRSPRLGLYVVRDGTFRLVEDFRM